MALNASIVLAKISGFAISCVRVARSVLARNVGAGTVGSSVEATESTSNVRSAIVNLSAVWICVVLVWANLLWISVDASSVAQASDKRIANWISARRCERAGKFCVTTS
jgi:hypothetical protein